MKNKNRQKKTILINKVLELYFQSYDLVKKQFHHDFNKNTEYPLDISLLIDNGTRVKNKKVVLRYGRTTYIKEQFQKSLKDLHFTLVKEHELTQRQIMEMYCCIKATNTALCAKLKQEKNIVDELNAKNLVAIYQVYNILNGE